MRIVGLDAGFFIVFVGQEALDEEGFDRMAATAEDCGIERMLCAYPERIALATTVDEAEAVDDTGKLVALIGMENASPLGNSVEDVPI